jgi:hypothetical protein
MIQINPLQSYIDGGARAAITTPPSASLVFDLPGKAIWVKGVKLKGIDHTYTFSHDNYITLTNTPDQNNPESEDIKIGVNITALKNVIDTTYDVVTASSDGLAPAFSSDNKATASANTTYHFLGLAGTTLKWYELSHRNIYVEATEVQSVSNTDPLKFSAGNGIEITWDSLNKKIVITNSKPDINHNTDTHVSVLSATDNKDYPLILKYNDNTNNEVGALRYGETLTYNPSTKILKINNAKVITENDVYVGATSDNNATVGLVPAATSAQRTYFLRGDGVWAVPSDANTWRPVQVGGSEKLGSATNTGALNFVAGTGIEVAWDNTNKRIVITNTAPDVNHNTHYTTSLYIGENNNTKANAAAVNPYLKLFDDDTRRNTLRFVAGDGITIGSDASGNITITNSKPDVNHNTNTWRPIKVSGSEKLGSGIDTGAIDFAAGTGITLAWDSTNKKITITNSSPDVNHNTDRTSIKLGTISGTKKTDSTLIINNSAAGLTIAGGTNKFSIGDGTNYIEVPITISHGLSTKNMTINGTAYALYTSASSLPTFIAPTSFGTANYILATNSSGNGFAWVAKPTSNVTTAAVVSNSATGTTQITAAQGNPYYNLLEGGSVTRSIRFVAGAGITISAATDG